MILFVKKLRLLSNGKWVMFKQVKRVVEIEIRAKRTGSRVGLGGISKRLARTEECLQRHLVFRGARIIKWVDK